MGIRSTIRRLLGRRRWRPVVAQRDSKAALSLSYLAFKDLITSNDELLELIADIERKLEGDTYFGMTYVRFRAVACATHAYRIVICLDKLSARRYQELHLVFGSIQRRIDAILAGPRAPVEAGGPFIHPLGAVDATLADRVGGKAANIGEVRNRVALPVPDGFAITTGAFAAFMAADQLGDEIRARQVDLDPDNLEHLGELSQELQRLVTTRPVPPPVADALLAGYDALAARVGGQPRVAVRSSAIGEDGDVSFAGQYVSVLNVGRDGIVEAYRDVVAGLYSPRALFYRAVHGIPDDDVPMAAVCMTLVEAAASGVACSADPGRPDSGAALITGAWGLGVATVGGSVSPDTWEVAKTPAPAIVRARPGWKETSAAARPGGGVDWIGVAAPAASAFCLADAQVLALTRLVAAAEAHYGRPQEVEWAIDAAGRFAILQCRPLTIARQLRAPATARPASLDGHRLLLTGATASAGCASGPVVHLAETDDAAQFPSGGVLVARHSSPQFVKVMGRAAAIVTDIGAATGHMASLAREFGVPAVLDARTATAVLAPGQVVTVDANQGAVYEGLVESLVAGAPPAPARTMRGTPVYGILRRVADAIVPLELTDPRDPGFRPGACRTFHDIARFAHEKAFEEMFRMSDRVADVTQKAVKLEERLPYELYLIDIGSGLRPATGPRIRPGDILSEPMRALLAGMTNPDLRWWEPRRFSLGGFLSVATESMMSPRDDPGTRRLGDRSYAIVAEAYCNFSSRIGYHFAAVDAYCSDSTSRNYVSFRFKGGAADDQRRAKRCELIGAILRRLDFQIEHRGDLVNARLRKFPREVILDRLDQLGRLVVATRQLDMRMDRGSRVEWFVEAFFAGNYLFDDEQAGASPAREVTPS